MTLTIAAAQVEPILMDRPHNLRTMEMTLRETAHRAARLVMFPEAMTVGYCFQDAAEALPFAEEVPGPTEATIADWCRQTNQFVVYGTLEKSAGKLFNTAVLVGPDGFVGKYRKLHLPYLGMDRFTSHGDLGLPVFDAGPLRVGMLICYDGTFPEAVRGLALAGADLVALPTNWPPGAETTAAHVGNARAIENHIYFAAINRVGTEREFRFIGQSRIVEPSGNTLADAGPTDPCILYAVIDPTVPRNKRLVRVPGKHIIDRFGDRRPECYGRLLEPVAKPTERR